MPAALSQERQVPRRSRRGCKGKGVNQELLFALPLGSVRVQARVSGSSQELLPPALAGVCKNSFRLRLFSAVRLMWLLFWSRVFSSSFASFSSSLYLANKEKKKMKLTKSKIRI